MQFSIHFYKQINLQQANQLFHFFLCMNQDVSLQSSSQLQCKDYLNLNSSPKFQRNKIVLNLNQKFNHTKIFNNFQNNDQFKENQKLY